MKRITQPLTMFVAILALAVASAAFSGEQVSREKRLFGTNQWIVVRCPGGGALEVSVGVATDGRLSYAVHDGEVMVLAPSPLGLTVDGVDLGKDAKLIGEPEPAVREIDETYALFGGHAQARNHAIEAEIPVQRGDKRFTLVVRVYNDGVGVRYLLPDGAKEIGGEATAWHLPEGVVKTAWMDFSPCYEGLSHVTKLAEMPEGKVVMGPIAVQLPHHYLAIAEADNENFSDLAFVRRKNRLSANYPFSPHGWPIQRRADEARPGGLDGTYRGRAASPWRTLVVARDLSGLVNSDLLTNLCPATAAEADFSWVKPGRCLWQWWSSGDPRYEEQRDWFDAAAKLKWEYYLIDDGWRRWKQPGKDQWALLKEVIDYGRGRGVKALVWVNSNEMHTAKSRRAYLEKVKACGATGIKIDFHPAPTADYMQWYLGAMQDCAELKLLVNFHGAVKPSGLRRTYPNDITREGVRGDEYHMSRYHRVMPLDQDESLPFTRALAGPADITPVMMNPEELKTSGFTWPHEFAQAIVFQSSVTHFADHYRFYVGSPLEDLFQQVPVVWDETRVLPCTEMGRIVAYARRRGDAWWLGVMNGGEEREVKVPLDFLKGQARGTLVYDHPTTAAAVDRRKQAASPTDVLTLKLRPAGGFVARFIRVRDSSKPGDTPSRD